MLIRPEQRVSRLALSYLLLFPLLFFVVRSGAFSFQTGGVNSDLGSTYGALANAGADSSLSRTEALAALLISAVFIASLYRRVLKTCLEEKIIILLPLYAVLSALWSQDAMLSLRNGIYLFINTCFAIYMFRRFQQEKLPKLVMFLGTITVLLSILLALGFPAYGLDHQGHEGAWQGLFSQKNTCAQAMVFLLAPAFAISATTSTARLMRAIYIGLIGLVIIETESRTGIVIALLYVGFMLALRFVGQFKSKDRSFVFLTIFTLAAIVIALAVNYLPTLLALLGRNSGLTGRSQIWSSVFESIMKHPLLGYGYAAFWTVLNGELSNIVVATGWVVTGAHNGFLNVWIELGAIGLALVLVTLAKAARNALTCFTPGRSRTIDWYIGILFLTIVYNLDERTLVAPQSLLWMLFIIACIGLSQAAKKERLSARTKPLNRTQWSSAAA